MKTAIALLLLFASTSYGADFEASLGRSSGMNNYAYSLGMTGLVNPNLRWRAGFASLGTPSYNRLASPSAAADDIAAGEGPAPYYWQGNHEAANELYFTLDPEMHRGNWTFALEGGIGIYKAAYHQDLSAGEPMLPYVWGPKLTPIVGVSIGYGKTSLVLAMQYMTPVGDNEDNLFHSRVETVSIRREFF